MTKRYPDRSDLPELPDDAADRAHRRETIGTLGTALALVLAMVGGTGAAETTPQPVPITVTAKGCEPMELKVPAGVSTFVITNRSSRALEWEILDGVMVVDERENIAPGFKQKLTTRLKPGTYEITCGLLDNPRGRLIVTGEAGGGDKPSAADLVGPVAEYRVVTANRLGDLDVAVLRLEAATAAGDRAAARTTLREARGLFLATTPVHGLVDTAARRVFADFDAIEPILATDAGDATAAVHELVTHVGAFVTAARPLVVAPGRLVGETVDLARRMVGELEAPAPASPGLLADVEAERGAVAGIVALFTPLASRLDPAASKGLVEALDRLRAELARAPGPIGGFADARTLEPDLRGAQATAARDVASRIATLPGLLGL